MTGPGAPREDVLDSADPEPRPLPRRWLALGIPVAALLIVAAVLFGLQALQPDPPTEQVQTPATGSSSAATTADPSLVDDTARRLYGDLPPMGARNFSTAVRAATDVVNIYCRPDIPSWSATLITSGDSYDRAIFLMSPANRRFGTFVVQVELVWAGDRFAYSVVAGHVERCT